MEKVLAQPGGISAAAQAGVSSSVLDAVHDAVTDATSASYYVAGAALALAGVVAFIVLRHVRATDAPTPVHAANVPAPRGAHARVSQA